MPWNPEHRLLQLLFSVHNLTYCTDIIQWGVFGIYIQKRLSKYFVYFMRIGPCIILIFE